MESIQSFYNNDSKKLTQLTAPSRQPGDMSFFNRTTDPIGENSSAATPPKRCHNVSLFPDCTFTSVSSDESKFLEDFMTFASDFGPKERPTLTELTVCDKTGQLSRQGLEAPLQSPCTVTSLASLPGQYGSGGYPGGYSGGYSQHQHRDKYPAKRRLHSTPFGEYDQALSNRI